MRTATRPPRRVRGFRPTLLALEGRRLLSTITVDDDRKQDRHADFTSIQAAVLAAAPNDKILVSPGTYREQVTIPMGKDGLKLISDKHWKAIIQAPATLTGQKAIVEVDKSRDVVIEGFTITGPMQGVQVGVLIDQGGSATVRGNHITDIRDDPMSGRQEAVGVYVRDGMGRILGNTIDDYQKAGILVARATSSAEVAFNKVKGAGPTGVIAQVGIQVSDGAVADVHDNRVSDNRFIGPAAAASGIILFNPGSATKVRNNEVTRNDVGIAVSGATNAAITGNSISRSTEDGIRLIDGPKGTLVANNESRKNGLDGIFVDSTSTNNVIRNNKLKQNKGFDAEDQSVGAGTAGTANTWQNNEGKTSSPPGLVQKKADKGHGHDDDDDDHDDGPGKAHGRRHADKCRDHDD
jgi:parallel beta-helix repeat protein